MKEIRSRVHRITQDLNALLEELAVVREESARELVEEVLTPQIIRGFKSSVDAMRRLLWFYIEAASQTSKSRQNLALEGVVDALRSMQESGSGVRSGSAADSFIEKVEAIVEKRIPSGSQN
jgi:heptaprenylglyceryl phosphate synthase